MGVKDLWNVLSPLALKSTLYDIQGKTIAVDLGCWVCEGQAVGDRVPAQPRMYLRNVFFRTQLLLMYSVKPVFVLDGKPPDVKKDTMEQRNKLRFANRQKNAEGSGCRQAKSNRSRFRGILKTCQRMLDLMGVLCIESNGEAEALCGQLSKEGVVDGVITQDSDVFLYGARVVYRNFQVKSGTGTLEIFDMDAIEKKLHLTREKLVAFSLMCGCDYGQAGVHGVGKETAFKYLQSFNGDILKRLKDLRCDKVLMRYEEERTYCNKCCHPGKASEHSKKGCIDCGLPKGCQENTSPLCYKNLDDITKGEVNLELSIRRKAITEPDFPSQETINEFMLFQQDIGNNEIVWLKPNITQFCLYSQKMLEWELDYGFEKILPLFTRWIMVSNEDMDFMELIPERLVKKRVAKGVPSFDISWRVNDENLSAFMTLLTDDCCVISEGNCCTTEPLPLIEIRVASLYYYFVEKTKKKVKEKKTRKKKVAKETITTSSIAEKQELKPVEVNDGEFDLSAVLIKNLNLGDANDASSPDAYRNYHDSSSCIHGSSANCYQCNTSFSGDIYLTNSSQSNDISNSIPADCEAYSAAAPVASSYSKTSGLSNSLSHLSLSDSITDDGDTTLEYDLSQILDDIISHRQFY